MSFKDTLTDLRDTLRSSNRQNLAHAYLRVEENITDLKKKILEQEELLKEIEEAGDESQWIDQNSATLVKGLHDRAHKGWGKY